MLFAHGYIRIGQKSGHGRIILEPKEAMMKYKVVLEPQEEGGYTVYVPTLPGCVSQGETTEEAMANIREAVEVYLESVNERGIRLPQIEEREVLV